ncbi:PilN domain-containing protein [Aquabacterium sp.]|uniref:PilN domain-containing protein n=1 Tax=Aquabacterium sp. TaxID=1872578 RepID=UPI0035B4314C
MTQQINLIDATAQAGRDPFSGRNIVVALGLAALALVGQYSFEQYRWQRVSAASAAAETDAQASSANAQQVNEQLAQLQAQIAADDQLRQAEQALLDPPKDCAARLQALVSTLPGSLWLRQVEFFGARNVRIAGSSLRSADVAGYVQALSGQTAFSGLPVRVLSFERREVTKESDTAEGSDGGKPAITWAAYDFEVSSLDANKSAGGAP